MSKLFPPCPHCGGKGFYVNGTMRGAVATYFGEMGEFQEMNLDRTYCELISKVVRCQDCCKVRRDVTLDNNKQIRLSRE